MNRRDALRLMAAGGAAAFARGLGPARAQDGQLAMMWWGGQDRARRTNAVGELFAKARPGLSFSGEALGSDYFPKLAVKMAGRAMPDLIQLEPGTYGDYCRRGAAIELEPLMPPIDLSGIEERLQKLCVVDGKTYGVGLGLNAFSMFYDTEMLAKVGASLTPEMTWKDYGDLAVELTRAGEGKMWGVADGARYMDIFDLWLHQRGKTLFNAEGKIGFSVEDASDWYGYWQDVRKRGGTVPGEVSSLDQHQIPTSALTLRKSAIGYGSSNQMVGYQLVLKPKLGIAMYPSLEPGAPSGHYYRSSQFLCISSSCRQPELAAEFLNFFLRDIEAGRILGVERGVPFLPAVREAVLADLNEPERASVDYVNLLADKVVETPPAIPLGAQEFDQRVMRVTADELSFEQIDVATAAQRLVDEGVRMF